MNSFVCEICHLSFASEILLKIHVEICNKFLCACNICNKQFLNTSLLIAHSNVCKKNYICNICKKVLKTKYRFKEHIRTHTGEKPFICMFCHRSYTQSSSLYKHFRNLHLSKTTTIFIKNSYNSQQ